jgi:iron-sulfur cluster assembly protein
MITITDDAARLIREKTAKGNGAIGLRLNIKSTGCSGNKYSMEFATPDNTAGDDRFEKDGAVLFIPRSESWKLAGMEIGFEKQGMGQEGFTFNNPNVVSTCGCGESFQIDPKLKQP